MDSPEPDNIAYKELFMALPNAALLLDQNGNILELNAKAQDTLVGLSPENKEQLINSWVNKLSTLNQTRPAITYDFIHKGLNLLIHIKKFKDGLSIATLEDFSNQKKAEQLISAQRDILMLIAEQKEYETIVKTLQLHLAAFLTEFKLGLYLRDEVNSPYFFLAKGSDVSAFDAKIDVRHPGKIFTHSLLKGGQVSTIHTGQATVYVILIEDQDQSPIAILAAMKEGQGPVNPMVAKVLSQTADLIRIADYSKRLFEHQQQVTQKAISEKKSQSILIDFTSDYIWSVDKEMNLLAANRSFRNAYGIDESHYQQRFDIPQEERFSKRLIQYMESALKGKLFTVELQDNSNPPKFFELSFTQIVDEHAQISGVTVMARNATEERKGGKILRENESNLKALLSNTKDMVFSLDRDFKIVIANPAYRKFIWERFDKEVASGKAFQLFENGPERDQWVEAFNEVLEEKNFVREFFYPKGEVVDEVYLEVSFFPIYNKLKNIINGISVFARDVTSRVKYEEELKRTNFELDSFVYRASHDMRAPLRSMLGLLNLLQMEIDHVEQREYYLKLFHKSIHKLDSFIDDLTNLSRNNRLEVKHEEVDFEEMMADVADNLAYMEQAEKVKVIINISGEVPFYSDNQRIAIIMQNLVSNGLKYHRPESGMPFVKVAIDITAERAHLVVEDNGKGISAHHLPHIFEMFYRASDQSFGSGLGLYIVRQVVDNLQGTIKVESKEGKYTTFELSIPNLLGKVDLA